MKEWILENKYVATLIGIIGGLGLVFGFIIYRNHSNQTGLEAEVKKYDAEIKLNQKKYGSPTPINLEKLKENVSSNLERGQALYDKLAPAGIHSLEKKKSNTDFKTITEAYAIRMAKTLDKGEVKYPQKSYFGFDRYSANLIKQNSRAIDLCLFQQEAFEWIFNCLSEVKKSELVRFHRTSLPEEEEDRTRTEKNPPIARKMPFDLVVNMTESQFGRFLEKISNSKKYLYGIKHIRVLNSTRSPIQVTALMKQTEATDSGTGGGGDTGEFTFSEENPDFDTGGETPPDGSNPNGLDPNGTAAKVVEKELWEAATPGEKIVEQIYGSEVLTIAFSMEIVLLKENFKLLKDKKKSGKKKGPASKGAKSSKNGTAAKTTK